MKYLICVIAIAVVLGTPGCAAYYLNKLSAKCRDGVKEGEVGDDYVHVVCKDHQIRARAIE